jgi:5-formyltetrahydrofolate cyclo-ligase
MIAGEKQSLRREARAKLKDFSKIRSRSAGLEIQGQLALWLEWHRSRSVCLFCALPSEPHLLEPWPDGKKVSLPRVSGEDLKLHYSHSTGELVEGKFGNLEPKANAPKAPFHADFILVPGLAFDPSGGRLGRGSGFYDRLLTKFEGVRVGVCFSELLVDEVPCEPHDIRMDFVVTPEGIISCET